MQPDGLGGALAREQARRAAPHAVDPVSGVRTTIEYRARKLTTSLTPPIRTPRPTGVRHGHSILILTAHAGALSLISTFVSLSGHTAFIPLDDELIEQAVMRTRPRAAIVDFEHPCAASSRVERQMTECGARVILFSAWHRSVEARARAAEMRAMFFALPIEHGEFDTLLRFALSS